MCYLTVHTGRILAQYLMAQTESILAEYQYLGSFFGQNLDFDPCGAHLYGSPQLLCNRY